MITTANPDLAKRARMMAQHGIDRAGETRSGERFRWRYEIRAPGYKANMTDLAASIGIRQLASAMNFGMPASDAPKPTARDWERSRPSKPLRMVLACGPPGIYT